MRYSTRQQHAVALGPVTATTLRPLNVDIDHVKTPCRKSNCRNYFPQIVLKLEQDEKISLFWRRLFRQGLLPVSLAGELLPCSVLSDTIEGDEGARTLSDNAVELGVSTGDFQENELAQKWQNMDVGTMAGTERSGFPVESRVWVLWGPMGKM
jgi:hypothetical protein